MEKSTYRKFGLLVGGILLAIGLWPLIQQGAIRTIPTGIGGLLIGLGLIFPILLKWPYVGWMKIGHVLGYVNTRIILGILFYLIVTPMGIVARLFGYDPLKIKKIKGDSFRQKPEEKTFKMERQF